MRSGRMVTGTLAKMSVCECGFPLLKEGIPLGTEYDIDLGRRKLGGLKCGGCGGMTMGLDCAFVEARETGQSAGYLPLEIFMVRTGHNAEATRN